MMYIADQLPPGSTAAGCNQGFIYVTMWRKWPMQIPHAMVSGGNVCWAKAFDEKR